MRGDPYATTARYRSTCPTCGHPILRGDRITVWPRSRKTYHYACSETDYLHALAAIEEEDRFTGGLDHAPD